MSITISIVEDNKGTREQLIKLFNNPPTTRCLNAYANGEDAIVGISKDSEKSHNNFIEKQCLTIDLVSDEDLSLHKKF